MSKTYYLDLSQIEKKIVTLVVDSKNDSMEMTAFRIRRILSDIRDEVIQATQRGYKYKDDSMRGIVIE